MVKQFFAYILGKYNLTEQEFFLRLGFANLNKAKRKVVSFIADNSIEDYFLSRILEQFPEEDSAIKNLKSSISEFQILENQKNFKPYIYVKTERRIPSPVFVASMTAFRDKIVEIKIDNPSIDLISETIRSHYSRYDGCTLCFGRILEYKYVQDLTTSIIFDANGQILIQEAGQFDARISVEFNINRKQISQKALEGIGLNIADTSLN